MSIEEKAKRKQTQLEFCFLFEKANKLKKNIVSF